mmetsp:Transcript_121821/g.327200  ORF Transcript_121821/g.327200 Transcript_121821/m.327200 type:complete len:281 (-) Transcript_121821:366-1208(-)
MDREGGVRHLHQRHPQVPRGPARRAGDVGLAARGRGQVRGRWRQQLPGGVAGQERPEVGLRGRHVLDLLQGGHPPGRGRGARRRLARRGRGGQLRAHPPRGGGPAGPGPRHGHCVRLPRVRQGEVLPRQCALRHVRRLLRRRRLHHQPRGPAAPRGQRRAGAARGVRQDGGPERHDDQLRACEARSPPAAPAGHARDAHVHDPAVFQCGAQRRDPHLALPAARCDAVDARGGGGGGGLRHGEAAGRGLRPRVRPRHEPDALEQGVLPLRADQRKVLRLGL